MILPIKYAYVSFRGNDSAISAREAYDKKTQNNDNIAKKASEESKSTPAKPPQIPTEGCGKKLDIKEA